MLPVCLLLACAILGTHGLPSRFESDELDPQIIGGKIIDIEKTPWQVSVERYKSHRCGGSIIAKRWTLTSARCVDSFIATVTDFGVRYGTASLGKGGTVLQVTWVGYHDKFDKDTYQYDVGLVQMAEDVVYSSTAQAIPLTPVGSLPRGTDLLTVSGWGEDSIYSYDYSYPDSLSAVSLPYIPRSTCQISYSTKGKIIDSTMICAGVTGKDACKGDEGGALVNAYGLQVGIASWSLGCDEPGFPSVFVNLGNAGVREFIQNKAGIV